MPERDPLRVMDAKLMAALYAPKIEWRTHWKRREETAEGVCYGSVYGDEQPCWRNVLDIWEEVPHYSTDIAAAWKAEGDLPEAKQRTYVRLLYKAVGVETIELGEKLPAGWALRRATPAQMCAAMLEVLGV